ncbi:ResB family protein [Sinomonas atrocyanea]|uniref:ResB family protein n=1 Tax=Sinomonas atrocyanea TaxID=37927 RepID=A0A127A5K7_9MICC|nr:ResB family protein [Sinomonas atrocyanea]GEB63474.1 cytochrome c biogenesis protein ResB [Sinomonas atrocyanea]GGG56489.1 cytochrome c biogenesis protein ResB [Sinomonas atrocyanea]
MSETKSKPDNQEKKSPKPAKGRKGRQAARTDVALPALGVVGMLRWAWTQLTSMRTALFLLLLLAVAAVPGSLFPQRPTNPAIVTQYLKDHADYGPILDKLQMFDVYSSVWFSAVYLLLFISLIGCVVPRAIAHWKSWRSKPPRTPARLSRLPVYGTLVVPAERGLAAADAAEQAAALLKKRGYRVDLRPAAPEAEATDAHDGGARRRASAFHSAFHSVGAEKGYLKELGNLCFHSGLVGVLVSVAIGGLFGYSGQRTLIEGETFVNTLVGYDTFNPGTDFQSSWLAPYSVHLDKFDVRYDRESVKQFGQPLDFTAHVTTRDSPSDPERQQDLKVNDPISIGATDVYLVGNGYAPVVTVRGGDGKVAFQGPVPAIPTDSVYTSTIVIKVPDAKPTQLGFVGFFLPTAEKGANNVAFSADPDPLNVQLNLNSYVGDLGLDKGKPQNVYALDVAKLTQVNGRDKPAGGIVLGAGQSYTMPNGQGSITFDGLKRYVALDIHRNPGQEWALGFALFSLAGLICSLFLTRRRLWVRVGQHEDGRTMVEYGLLTRGEDHGGLAAEGRAVRAALAKAWDVPGDGPGAQTKNAKSTSAATDTSASTTTTSASTQKDA